MVTLKAFLIILTVFSFSLAAQAKESQTYLVQKKHLKYFPGKMKTAKNIGEDFVRVSMTEAEIDRLAKVIHSTDHQCGGFAEVDASIPTESLQKQMQTARLAEEAENEFSTLEPQYPQQVNQFLSLLNQQEYMSYINQLSQFNDRSARTQTGEQASEWIKNKVEEWKSEFNREKLSVQFIDTPRYRQKSILVKLEGRKPQLPSVVVGGHMDTLTSNKPGADDDASGSATLFEVLHKILKSGSQFERTVYLVFYAAEEVGLVGSRAVVNHFVNNNISVRAVMQLDMTGYAVNRSKNKVFFVTDYTNRNLTLYTKKLAKAYLGKSDDLIGELRCNYACSDHARWTNKGFPAVFPFESTFGDHNPDIHTSRDTEHTVSPEHAFQFVKLAGAFIVELAEPQTSIQKVKISHLPQH